MKISALLGATLVTSGALFAAAPAASRPNILMFAVDDLRPQLGCYGVAQVKSPNIDRLAASGTRFENAFCMVPTCGASRASLMTSIRPAPQRFVTHLAYAEKEAPGIPTLNTLLKQSGYTTLSNGKVFHHLGDSASGWSEPAWRPSARPAAAALGEPKKKDPKAAKAAKTGKQNQDEDGANRGAPYEMSALADEELADGQIAQKTIADLQRLKAAGKPFFLAAGFMKPHLPFVAPKKYWDLYPAGSLALPATYRRPKDAPDEAIHNSGELRAYAGVPKTGPLSDELARTLIRGYHACVSFTDAQIGKVLAELDRLGLAENTIVLLWGDHGWNLGEHTLWCKHCCFETSMRVPLIVRVPGLPGGTKTAGLTELIDVYPSLCELTGLAVPSHVQGRSFAPLLRNPAQPWKDQAIGRFGPGDTIRTADFRFTEYTDPKRGPVARMLYDHRTDAAEDINVSEQPASAATVAELTARLRAGKGKDGDLPKR